MSMSAKDENALLQEIEADLQEAPRRTVIYLEVRSDVSIFFGLIGVPEPPRGIHEGVLVRGLSPRSGAGCKSVKQRVELASRRSRRGVYGIIDGDGESLAACRSANR
jgi:hypothetical protein